jgi:type IV secretion system protein VirB1
LERAGYNYSVGLAQINKHNFAKFGLTFETAFDACPNLHAGAEILKECFDRANQVRRDEQAALRDAFSCYYSGNFLTGYKLGYVFKVVNAGQVGPAAPMTLQARASSLGGAPRAVSVSSYQKNSFKAPRPVLAAVGEVPPTAVASSQSALLF